MSAAEVVLRGHGKGDGNRGDNALALHLLPLIERRFAAYGVQAGVDGMGGIWVNGRHGLDADVRCWQRTVVVKFHGQRDRVLRRCHRTRKPIDERVLEALARGQQAS